MRLAHMFKALEWRKKLVDPCVLNLLRVKGEDNLAPGSVCPNCSQEPPA